MPLSILHAQEAKRVLRGLYGKKNVTLNGPANRRMVSVYGRQIIAYYPDGSFSLAGGPAALLEGLNQVLPEGYRAVSKKRKVGLIGPGINQRDGRPAILISVDHGHRFHSELGAVSGMTGTSPRLYPLSQGV